ncbi:MAG: 50S ribosomal protein L10 [Deltaproteobacteria bacterium]|nr:50S ribosomal protein L10 [Deltaproteobacteria bacterium]
MDRSTKEQVVAELHGKLKDTKLAVLVDYKGMNVRQITELRNQLRKVDGEMKVVKNSLLRIALKDTDFVLLEEYLKDPRALIMNYGDVVEPTKALVEFAKKNAELEVITGVLEGRLLTGDQIKVLADLPSKDVLIAKLLSLMVAVQTQLVTVLSAVPRSFVQVLEAYRVKREESEN